MSDKLFTPILLGKTLVLVARLIFGCMFIWSGSAKIRQPYNFLSDVYRYELVGPRLGILVAMVLPWFELLVGLCLVGGVFIGGALLACIILACVFIVCHISALVRQLPISCGCFGPSESEIVSYTTLMHTGLIFLGAVLGYICFIVFGLARFSYRNN